jgi:hypothetical protein
MSQIPAYNKFLIPGWLGITHYEGVTYLDPNKICV